jgi:hypothetical protein
MLTLVGRRKEREGGEWSRMEGNGDRIFFFSAHFFVVLRLGKGVWQKEVPLCKDQSGFRKLVEGQDDFRRESAL